ncbi:MAG: hypothetical protein WDA12_05095 [Bacilli bacterium]
MAGKKPAPAAKATTGKSVVKKEEERKDLLPEIDYGEDAGAGFEDIGQEDLAIPFLAILQSGSPQVDEDEPGYIDGAKAGAVLNTVTQEVYDGKSGVLFVPVHRVHNFVEWVPRDQGGGFAGVYEPDDPIVIKARRGGAFGRLESPDGNDLVETFTVFGLLVHKDGSFDPAIIAFSSTQIKHYKRWMTQARGIMVRSPSSGQRINPPLFSHAYRLTTKQESNNKGKWHGWSISFDGGSTNSARLEQDSDVYQAAKGLREMVTSGAAKANYSSVQQDSDGDNDEI